MVSGSPHTIAALQPSGLTQQATFIWDRNVLPVKLQPGVSWLNCIYFIRYIWCEVFVFEKHQVAALRAALEEATTVWNCPRDL